MHNIRKFLAEGDKDKVVVWFRGREISHHELGLKLLVKIRDELGEVSKIDYFPDKLEGKQMIMVLYLSGTKEPTVLKKDSVSGVLLMKKQNISIHRPKNL